MNEFKCNCTLKKNQDLLSNYGGHYIEKIYPIYIKVDNHSYFHPVKVNTSRWNDFKEIINYKDCNNLVSCPDCYPNKNVSVFRFSN